MSPHEEYVQYWGQQNINLTAVWQYDSCGTQGCAYDVVSIFIYGACSTTQGLHAVLLRVVIMSHMFFAHIITHTEQWSYYVPGSIFINNSLKRSSFSVSDVTDEHNIYLGLFTKLRLLFARLIAIYFSGKIYSMFPPTYISCDYCCVTFVSLFINLRHSRDFTSHTSRRGTLY